MLTGTSPLDTIGVVLGLVDTIGKAVNKHDSVPEVVERPVVVQQPSTPVPSVTDQVINVNLTVNIYDKDGKLALSTKKEDV